MNHLHFINQWHLFRMAGTHTHKHSLAQLHQRVIDILFSWNSLILWEFRQTGLDGWMESHGYTDIMIYILISCHL